MAADVPQCEEVGGVVQNNRETKGTLPFMCISLLKCPDYPEQYLLVSPITKQGVTKQGVRPYV